MTAFATCLHTCAGTPVIRVMIQQQRWPSTSEERLGDIKYAVYITDPGGASIRLALVEWFSEAEYVAESVIGSVVECISTSITFRSHEGLEVKRESFFEDG